MEIIQRGDGDESLGCLGGLVGEFVREAEVKCWVRYGRDLDEQRSDEGFDSEWAT